METKLSLRFWRVALWGTITFLLFSVSFWTCFRVFTSFLVEKRTIAPHDLRRTCARLCHQAGGELEQIQFLLGHVSVQTTERYLGCKQRFRDAVNDHIGLETDAPS
jgi:site-specific recombinase XerD